MDDRICEVGRGVHGMNHYQVVDVARILGINFINTHTITDNMVDEYIRLYLEKKNPYRIGELIDALMEIPEYQIATRQGAGPTLFAGSPKHRTGKFIVEMTGGTEPSNKLYEHFSRMGISTLVSMHIREASMEKAKEQGMNIVVAGHMSSDSLGMNLFLDELEKQGIEIIPCGGLIRVSRNKATKLGRKEVTKKK
jgi:putative NIF3 family GTP cyclohydrolase 1 type 2